MPELDIPDLSKKVGPLPLGVWLAAGAVGVGVGLYFRRSLARSRAAEAEAAPAAIPTVIPNALLVEDGARSGSSNATTPTAGPPITTNNAWSSYVTGLLVAEGFDPTTVATAIGRYLSGRKLDAQQDAIIDLALRKAGPPPTPPALAPDDPAPAPTPEAEPLYPNWKVGPGVKPANPNNPPAPGYRLIQGTDRYTWASPYDYEDFGRLVANINAGRPPV